MGVPVLFLSFAAISSQQSGFQQDLKALADAKSDPAAISARIEQGLRRDELQSASDFLAAARHAPLGWGRLPEARVRYELALTALCLGERSGRSLLCESWDTLFDSVSRPRRIAPPLVKGEKARYQPTSGVIRDVWNGKALAKPALNPRIKVLFDEDQAARQGDFSKFTAKDIEKMRQGDVKRLAEARSIVGKRNVSTGADFERLAFVFQHSSTFEDYATAHELSVCAVILGNASASWIAGASYDRMMLSASYPQRFGTQFRYADGKYTFDLIDTALTNDRERKAVIRKTLDEAIKVFDK